MDDSDKGTQLGTAQPEKDTGKAGFVRQLTEIVVEKVDAAVESPNNRALRIHEILRNSIDSTGRTPNDWDMICGVSWFNVSYISLVGTGGQRSLKISVYGTLSWILLRR